MFEEKGNSTTLKVAVGTENPVTNLIREVERRYEHQKKRIGVKRNSLLILSILIMKKMLI